jgi:hypothetical protein
VQLAPETAGLALEAVVRSVGSTDQVLFMLRRSW